MTRSSGTVVFRFNPQKREPPRRNGLGCHKTERPGLTAPCMIVVCRICHASPARGVFQTADGFGCIAPQHRCPWRAGAYRRDSPSSLWEGVSKFHYPPRCPRARFASTGSKAALNARPACPSPPELAVVAARLTSLSRGFRIGNTVYSVFSEKENSSHLSGGFGGKCTPSYRDFFKLFFIAASPRSTEQQMRLRPTPSAAAISALLIPRK